MATIPLDQLADKLGARLDEAAKALKIAVFSEAVRRTVVDTGRLRGNWQISNDSPATGTVSAGGPKTVKPGERAKQPPPAPSGDQISAIAQFVDSGPGASLTYLTNNLPYASVIDARDGIVSAAVSHGKNNMEAILRGGTN